MTEVIHSIHFPVSARSFVEPMVKRLNQAGIDAEMWIEDHPHHTAVIQRLTVPLQFVESDLSFHPVIFWRKLCRYRQQLRMAQPKILHTHQTRASFIPLLAAYLEQVPIRIYHNHGLPYLGYHGLLRWLLRGLEVINMRLATQVLLVSSSNLAAARSDGLLDHHQGRILAHGSAIGLNLTDFHRDRFGPEQTQQARQQWGIADGAFVLAYVGRPVRRKGFHLLLKAWERSKLGQQNHVLIIAGCTVEDCRAAIGSVPSGLKGLGYLTDLQGFYTACDAVVLPSQHEGFGYSLLEGAAAAKPLIGTDIPGVRCAIQHQKTGLLVPPQDEVALSEAIQQLAADPELRSQLGKNARKRVEQEFSREIVLADLLKLYQTELLA